MSWPRFLFIVLPLSLLALAAAVEGVAFALSGISPRRHDLDRIVAALDHAKLDAAVAIIGDSVTQDVLKTYRIAPPGQIANLTTNQASGLIGAAFLLHRYLERNAPPKVLIMAATPEFYVNDPDHDALPVYVTSVFRRADERAELDRLEIGDRARWRPAAFAVKQRVWDKLTGLLAPAVTELPVGDSDPTAIKLETAPLSAREQAAFALRARKVLGVAPSVRRAFELICAASAQHGFKVRVLRAPLPVTVLAARGASEVHTAMLRQAAAGCPAIAFDDINSQQAFPDTAFRDTDHLQRPGWTALYGCLLADYVRGLLAGGQ